MTKSKFIFGSRAIWVAVACLAMLEIAYGAQKLCGDGLVQTLDLICGYNGFNAYKNKRNSLSPEDDDSGSIDNEDNFALNLDMWPYLSGLEANSLAKTRRRRHGITHECCDKPCSVSEIKSYCRREPY